MGVTAFPFDAVLDVTPSTLLGNDTATAAPAKALTTTQVRALLGVYTTAQVDALLSGKSDAGHTHAYSSLTGIPATFPPSAHNQAWSTITGTPTTLAGYGITDAAASGHTHPQSDVTGLTSALAAKADLVGGLVPANQLPSFVDDVLEFANLAAFPATGESGKIYVALDTSRTYRWGGSTYAELTDSTAVWGSISGVLANQTDLASALSGKSDTGHTHAYSSLTGIPSTFTPSAHQHAASDISSGTLDIARVPTGTTNLTVCIGNDSRLSDARTPVAHKASHVTGQPDALSPSDIGAVPTARTLTINGTAFDLSADRSWTVSGGGGGISSLNGLTDATQTFQTGTTGTNFGIVSTAGVHTFNLPDASATARGVVTTGAQTFAGAKTFSTKVTVPATGTTAGGIGNGANGIDFFGGVMTYVSGGGYPTYTSAQSFRLGQNVRIEWSGTDNDGYTPPNTRIERWESGHVSVRFGLTSCKLSVTNSFTDGSNYERAILQFVTYASARYAQLACESAGTGIANMNLVLSPKGTGALIAGAVPDGTAVGGNARGANAVDLQLYRATATQVASGQDSFVVGYGCTASNQGSICIGNQSTASGIQSIVIGGLSSASGIQSIAMGGGGAVATGIGSIAIGYYCTASGHTAFSVGYQNLASGERSVATGMRSLANRHGQRAHAAGSFTNTPQSGQAQCVEFVLRNKTTDGTTAVTLLLDGETLRLTIRTGTILFATIHLVGSKSGGTAVATYMRKFAIRNLGGTTALIGAVETIGTDVTAGTSFSLTADDTNDAINPSVIGVSGETWWWVAVVYGVELAYGT